MPPGYVQAEFKQQLLMTNQNGINDDSHILELPDASVDPAELFLLLVMLPMKQLSASETLLMTCLLNDCHHGCNWQPRTNHTWPELASTICKEFSEQADRDSIRKESVRTKAVANEEGLSMSLRVSRLFTVKPCDKNQINICKITVLLGVLHSRPATTDWVARQRPRKGPFASRQAQGAPKLDLKILVGLLLPRTPRNLDQ